MVLDILALIEVEALIGLLGPPGPGVHTLAVLAHPIPPFPKQDDPTELVKRGKAGDVDGIGQFFDGKGIILPVERRFGVPKPLHQNGLLALTEKPGTFLMSHHLHRGQGRVLLPFPDAGLALQGQEGGERDHQPNRPHQDGVHRPLAHLRVHPPPLHEHPQDRGQQHRQEDPQHQIPLRRGTGEHPADQAGQQGQEHEGLQPPAAFRLQKHPPLGRLPGLGLPVEVTPQLRRAQGQA